MSSLRFVTLKKYAVQETDDGPIFGHIEVRTCPKDSPGITDRDNSVLFVPIAGAELTTTHLTEIIEGMRGEQ